jgi:hypothetical protein
MVVAKGSCATTSRCPASRMQAEVAVLPVSVHLRPIIAPPPARVKQRVRPFGTSARAGATASGDEPEQRFGRRQVGPGLQHRAQSERYAGQDEHALLVQARELSHVLSRNP